MFLGYTPSGNRRYKPYTAENIIAQMKKEGLLSGENFDYGLSSLMSRFATKQKSIYSIDVIEQKSSGNEKTLRNNSKQHDTAINSIAHIQDVFKTKLVQQYNNDYFCEVVVKSNKDRQGFYIHEIELKEKLTDVFSTAHHGTSVSSKSIIADLINKNNPAQKVLQKAKEVVAALKKIADGSEEETVKDLRNDLEQYGGTNDVTFVFGNDKKGIKHIAQKHGSKTLLKVFDTVVDGKVLRYVPGKKSVVLSKGDYEAVLSLDENGNKKTWLLSGWNTKEKSSDVSSEVSTQSTSTQIKPTFSRQDLGAELNNSITNSDGDFYVTNHHLRNNKLNTILKNGQIKYDLSDLSAVQNAPDNTIINEISQDFNPKQSQKRTGCVFQESAQPNNNVAVVSAYDEIINISEEKKNNRVLYDKKKELSKTLSASKAVTIDNSDTIITNSASNFNPKQSQKRTGYVFQEPAQPNLFVENAAQNHNKGFVGIDLKGNRGLTDINRNLILIGTTGYEQIYKNSYRNKTIKHKR